MILSKSCRASEARAVLCECVKAKAALLGCLLLAGDRHRLALAGAGVGVGALTAHRQTAAMAQAAIAAQNPSGA
jgi:hypothetical protein